MTEQNKTWWQSIKNDLYAAYEGIVNFVKNPFNGLTHLLRGKENPDLVKLHALRNKHYDLIAQEATKAQSDYNALTKTITADTKKYIQDIIDEETKKLGIPPCEFTIFTMGSMAREETGPITDLEIGIIVKEKTVENYKYFYQLTQNISDRLFLLGEHPDIGGKGFRMDEADNAPPHKRFFARNATPEQEKQLLNEAILKREWDKIPYEGSRPFLTTADEFASYSANGDFSQDRKALHVVKDQAFAKEWAKAQKDPKNKAKLKTKAGRAEIKREINYWLTQMYRPFSAKELGIANEAGKSLGRNMAHLYGSTALYNNLQAKKNKYLNVKLKNGRTQRQDIAMQKMIGDIQAALEKGKSVYVTGELGKTMDIKREFYRFTEQFVTNLGYFHSCKNQNPIEILKELVSRKIMSPQLSAKITDFIQFSAYLRLKEQSLLKRQGFAAYFNEDEFNEDKEDLENQIKKLNDSIEFLEAAPSDPRVLADKKRKLIELKDKYNHLLEMAPNNLYSVSDIKLLNEKYAPMAHVIFNEAMKWTKGQKVLGFDVAANKAPKQAIKPQSAAALVDHAKPFTPALEAKKQADKPEPAIQIPKKRNFQSMLIAALQIMRLERRVKLKNHD